MRKLLAKIRKILKDRRTRQLLTRTVSVTAAIVVFVTTYALVLPAITMETEAQCGIEAHQHDSSCYEDRLICDIPESDGHQHTASCYEKILICGKQVHTHSTECYSPANNTSSSWSTEYAAVAAADSAAAGVTVQTFMDDVEILEDDSFASSAFSTSSTADSESDGAADLYATFSEDIDASSGDAAGTDDQLPETADSPLVADSPLADDSPSSESDANAATETDTVINTADGAATNEIAVTNETSTTDDTAVTNPDAFSASGTSTSAEAPAVSTTSAASDTSAAEPAATSSTASVASTASTASAAARAFEEDSYVPSLDPLDFSRILTTDTGIYYYHVEDKDSAPENSGDIKDWKPLDEDTILDPADILRVYLAYSIPAGSLNATNPVARYRLPSNLHLSEKQVESINATVNGIANQYVSMDTLEITDPEKYKESLGVEAIEGNRIPSDDIEEYFEKHRELDGQEYISATVKTEDVYDVDEVTGEYGEYLGQELIFTFTDYTIAKNRHEYDRNGQPAKAGEKVDGWVCFDLKTSQVDWIEVEKDTQIDEREADTVEDTESVRQGLNESEDGDNQKEDGPASEENKEKAASNSTALDSSASAASDSNSSHSGATDSSDSESTDLEASSKITKTTTVKNEAKVVFAEEVKEDKKNDIDGIEEISTTLTMEETVIDESETPAETDYLNDEKEIIEDTNKEDKSDADSNTGIKAETKDASEENNVSEENKASEENNVSEENASSDKTARVTPETHPAASFEESLTVYTGRLNSDTETGKLPDDTKLTVSVSADECTFPAGTTMKVSAVTDDQMDTVAAAVESVVASDDTVSNRTRGFQAVDITFYDADGNEIEPLKSIRVSMKSDEIRRAVEDETTAPIVVHVSDTSTTEEKAEIDTTAEIDATEEIGVIDETGKTAEISGDHADENTEENANDNEENANENEEKNNEKSEKDTADLIATVIETSTGDEAEKDADLTFEAGTFSVYAIVYTVDFHYEVNGKMYEYTLPGGGFVSFYKLVEVLSIATGGENGENGAENAENGAESGNDFVGEVPGVDASGENGEGSTEEAGEAATESNAASTGTGSTTYEEAIKLNEVEVSEATKKFVADVASVEFSSRELVWVGKVDEAVTVGGLKEANGLEIEYSAELTEEQIAEINAQTVEAGDWALISVRPFTSEESLTVTMKNGDQFVVKVTDALVSSSELDTETPYVLYGMYQGQCYALKYDGSCVPVDDLDAIYENAEFQWYYYTEGGVSQWRSPIPPNGYNYNYINLYYLNFLSAVGQDWGSNIRLEADPSGGYYFRTDSWDGNTYTLWLYYSYIFREWRFVSGTGEGNGSVTYIYKKGEQHQLTVAVDDESHGDVYLNDTDRWVTSGQTAINSNGTNATQIWARAKDGYWFDHWELDGQSVPESDTVQVFEDENDGHSVSWIAQGGLNVDDENGHVLTAVFTPEISFTVEASPAEGGTVDKVSSVRTRDGFNKEQITATAAEGYWFDHWELDGTPVEPGEGKAEISEDGSVCTLQQGGINIGEAEKLTAVFREKVTYTVSAVAENGEPFAAGTGAGCLVKVGEGESAATVQGCEMTWDGKNVQQISAVAGPGYVFKGWMVDDQEILGGAEIESALDGSESSVAAGTLLIGSDSGDHVVKAMFAQEYTFTVSTYPTGGGTVQDDSKPASGIIYASMTKDGHNKYAITASANTGYGFMYWKLNGQPIVDEGGDYLYTDGTIPAGVLTLTSSDNVEAVFVDGIYTITVEAGSNGRVNRTSVTTETNSSVNKQSLNTIIATANSNYKFAYWKVEHPETIVDWGTNYSATTRTIQPTVNDNTKLTAMFVGSDTTTYVITVDDPSYGTVYTNKDVSGTNSSVYGSTTIVGKVNSSNKNDGQIEIRTIAPGYEFVGWNVYYPNGTLYQTYTNTAALQGSRIASNSVNIPEDGMIIKAMFAEKATPPAFQDDSMADLTDWANGIAATNFDTDKTAEVFDYDNRIYRIEMSASSKKQAIDSSVVINFITDTSRSMYFPANITKVADVQGYSGSSFGAKIKNWLNGKNTANEYYVITGQNGNATLYAIYYDTEQNKWLYVDASYYGPNAADGQTRSGSDNWNGFNIGDNPNNYYVYQAPVREANKPWSRLDYLTMSVETAVKAIYAICPNAQIDLTTFNRSSSYRGTIPNNDAAIESMLRTIDVAGGTRQDLGLGTALEHFTDGSSKRQIAVLITDGAPNNGSVPGVTEAGIRTAAGTNAGDLKALTDVDGNPLEIYTMGLSIKNVGNNESWLAGLATDADHAKSVETGAETEEAIKQIVNDLLTEVSLFGSMKDTVDPAFYPVDVDGNPIAAGLYAADGSTLSTRPTDDTPYYEWADNDGTWTITWYNQTFAWADGTTPGWQKNFYVKAKEDFLGGNKISTNNGSSNGMTATGYVKADTSVTPLSSSVTKTFDYTPYVNVDELHMEGNETEWTVYLGTEVDPETQLKLLLDEIPVKQVVHEDGTTDSIYITGAGKMYYQHSSSGVDNDDEAAPPKGESQTLPLSYYEDYTNLSGQNIIQVVNDAIAALEQSETASVIRDHIVYTEYGHAAGEFKVTVTKAVNAEAAEDGAPGSHETKQPGQAVETYTLKVEYTPYTTGAADTYDHTTSGGSAGEITNGTGANKVESENSHVINVIAKGIEVIKTDSITGEEITDKQATFKLYRALKTGEAGETTITVKGNTVSVVEVTELVTGGATGANKFANLPWYKSASCEYDGQYFLKEEDEPEGYLKLSVPAVITLAATNAYTDLDGVQVEEVEGIPYNNTQTATLTVEVNGETEPSEEEEGVFSVIVPNPPKGSLALRKAVQTIGADIATMNGKYTFSVSGPVGSAAPVTYYLDLTVVNGEMTTYKVEKYAGDNAERNPANIVEQETDSVTDRDQGYVITDMETGIYALKELPWDLTNKSIEDNVYLSDITIVPGSGGNTNDMVARTTSVWVTADKQDEPVLTVTFVNEYAPEKVRFTVEKVWQDKDGNMLEEPWDGRISLIEFSVSQSVAGSDEERLLTFNGDERMTVDRSGRCAFLTPEEAGSAAYTVRWTSGGDSWQTILSGLEKKDTQGNAYSYRIEELTVRDVTGGIVTGYETTYGLSSGGGELIEEDGQAVGIRSVNDGATATICNKEVQQAGLIVKKILEVNDEKPLNGDPTQTNGSYIFTVTGPDGSDSPITKYVKIIASSTDHGENAGTRYTTTYTYQIGDTESERDAMTPISTVNGGVPIDNLTPGKYTITEMGWTFDTTPVGSMMYLKNIDVSSGANNETSIAQKTAEVYVGEGEIGGLSVAFTNCLKPYPGIQIEKIDETTRPSDETTKYLTDAEFQILKWTGSNYQVYPNAADSKSTTNSDGLATFAGIEPGEYKIVETATPPGYVKFAVNDIYINVAYNELTGLHTITRYKEPYTGDDDTERTEVGESENLMGVTFAQATDEEDTIITVGNEPGAALPNTGGPGTTVLYLLGIMLTGLAGAGLVMRRRRKAA